MRTDPEPWRLAGLKRHLRPAMVADFLAKSAPLLPEGSLLYLFSGGRAVFFGNGSGRAPAGEAVPGPERPLAPGEAGVAAAPFTLADRATAFVCALPPAGEADWGAERGRVVQVLELAAKGLDGMVELEAARRSLGAETLGQYRELAVLHRSIHSFNNTLRLRGITEALINDCRGGELPAEAGILFLRESSETGFEPCCHFGPVAELGLAEAPRTRLFAAVAECGQGEIVNEAASDPRWGLPVPGALLVQPVLSPNLCLGAIVLASAAPGRFAAAHLRHLATVTSVAGMAIENAFNFEGVQLLMDALLKALAAAIDSRDHFTSGHSERVARLAVALARQASREHEGGPLFLEHELREIYYAGILHDVGKIGVREQVLTKGTRLPREHMDVIGLRMDLLSLFGGDCSEADLARLRELNAAFDLSPQDQEFIDRLAATRCQVKGRKLPVLTEGERDRLRVDHGNLTADERREIQRHPAESHRILRHIPFPEQYRNLLPIIRQHHERLDGSGYPAGERSQDILVQSRILAIVDTYDAITQERHYKRALPRAQALQTLAGEAAGGRLDPDLVALFCARIDDIEREAEGVEPKAWRGFKGEGRSQ